MKIIYQEGTLGISNDNNYARKEAMLQNDEHLVGVNVDLRHFDDEKKASRQRST